MRRIAASLAAGLVLGLAPATPAAAQGDTTAIAINTKDGFDLFRLAFQIRRATQDTVDTTNAAVAYASCTDCQTVAIAIQIVLISGYDSSTVTPQNLAIAINESCVLCDTLASAYQFVITAEGQLRFTAEGNRALAEIRRALLDLRRGELTAAEIQAKLDELMTRLADVLANELVTAGNTDDAGEPPASPTATPTAASTTAPAESPAATEPAPSESTTPSPTAEPSATETP